MTLQLNRKELFLVLAATSIALIWVFTQHVTFNSDSTTYLHYANWLSGNAEISPFWYLRSPGLPLILILSGVTFFKNFLGFMLLQALFAVGIVWLIYKLTSLFQPKFALFTAWSCMFTAVPFAFSTMITVEQVNIFAYIALIYCLVAFSSTRLKRYIYLAAVANILLFLLKPSNYYIFVFSTIFVLYFSRQQRIKNMLRFLLPYGLVMLLYIAGFGLLKLAHPGLEGMSGIFQGIRAVAYLPYSEGALTPELNTENLQQDIFTNPNPYNYNTLTNELAKKYGRSQGGKVLLQATAKSYMHHPALITQLISSVFSSSANNYTGQMLFYPLMLKVPYVAKDESDKQQVIINPNNGPATQAMFSHLRNYIVKREYLWSTWEPKELFSNFAGRPEAFLNNIFKNPNHVYHAFIWQALDREIGPTATSKLFMDASLEGFKKYPAGVMCFLDDLIAYFFGFDVTYKTGYRVMFLPNPGLGEKAASPYLSDVMQQQITAPLINVNSHAWDNVYNAYSYIWLLTKVFIVIFALIGLFMSINTPAMPLFLFSWALIGYNALITCVFADPFFRYSSVTWLITAVIALQTVCSLIEKKLPFLKIKKNLSEFNDGSNPAIVPHISRME